VFAIYVCSLTLKWIIDNGGLSGMEKRNKRKSEKLYSAIDNSPLFKGTAATEDRSWMNVTFVMEDSSLDSEFMDMATEAGCVGIKGHRSVGGFRASIYNALPEESVDVLVDVINTFSANKG